VYAQADGAGQGLEGALRKHQPIVGECGDPGTRAHYGLIAPLQHRPPEPFMGNKIITEADRKATPRPAAPSGVTVTTQRGQKVSLERGSHTRSKKNPGKRAKKGG
jgi:hypothetical protein